MLSPCGHLAMMQDTAQGHSASDGPVQHEGAVQKPVLTLDHIQDVQELKRGRYSVVYRGECSPGKVAVKVYEKPSMAPKKQKMATREAIVLKYLNSQGVPNITHMWSAYSSQDRFHIIMEYCQGGNLLDFLKTQQPHGVPEHWLAAAVAAPLLRTLAAMHAVGVTHRDVKLENIFLDASGAVKLGDFDLAVFHHEAQVGVLCCAGCCSAWAQGSVDNW